VVILRQKDDHGRGYEHCWLGFGMRLNKDGNAEAILERRSRLRIGLLKGDAESTRQGEWSAMVAGYTSWEMPA